MEHATGAIRVRSAAAGDLREVRTLVTRTLLGAGYDPPSPERDADLHDPTYYEAEGRSLWVAIDEDRHIVGCIAVDAGDDGAAVLRRLAGAGLYALIAAAVQFARRRRYRVAEVVLTPGMERAQRAGNRGLLDGHPFRPAALPPPTDAGVGSGGTHPPAPRIVGLRPTPRLSDCEPARLAPAQT